MPELAATIKKWCIIDVYFSLHKIYRRHHLHYLSFFSEYILDGPPVISLRPYMYSLKNPFLLIKWKTHIIELLPMSGKLTMAAISVCIYQPYQPHTVEYLGRSWGRCPDLYDTWYLLYVVSSPEYSQSLWKCDDEWCQTRKERMSSCDLFCLMHWVSPL